MTDSNEPTNAVEASESLTNPPETQGVAEELIAQPPEAGVVPIEAPAQAIATAPVEAVAVAPVVPVAPVTSVTPVVPVAPVEPMVAPTVTVPAEPKTYVAAAGEASAQIAQSETTVSVTETVPAIDTIMPSAETPIVSASAIEAPPAQPAPPTPSELASATPQPTPFAPPTPTSDAYSVTETPPQPEKKSKKKLFIIIGAIVAVIIVALVIIGVVASQPVPVPTLDRTETVGDLTFDVSGEWQETAGTGSVVYYYPFENHDTFFMTMNDPVLDNDVADTGLTDAEVTAAVEGFTDGLGAEIISSDTSTIEALRGYKAFEIEAKHEISGKLYRQRLLVHVSLTGKISIVSFITLESDYSRMENLVDAVMATVAPTSEYNTKHEEILAERERIRAEEEAAAEAERQRKEAEAQAERERREAEAQAERDRIANQTVSQKNAVQKAKDYIRAMPFSYEGLIEQLEYEGFSRADAEYGVQYCGADWMRQVERHAENYMRSSSFSRQRLIDQLLYEGYTREEANHGADYVGL